MKGVMVSTRHLPVVAVDVPVPSWERWELHCGGGGGEGGDGGGGGR